jgi:hypothetical protein
MVIMNIISKALKWISASGFVMSTLFVVNLYFVYDDTNATHCKPLLRFKNIEFCYNLTVSNYEFCPIGNNGVENG